MKIKGVELNNKEFEKFNQIEEEKKKERKKKFKEFNQELENVLTSIVNMLILFILAGIFFTAQYGILTLLKDNQIVGIALCIGLWGFFGALCVDLFGRTK